MKRYQWVLWVSLVLGGVSGLYSGLLAVGKNALSGGTAALEILGNVGASIVGWFVLLALITLPFALVRRAKQKKQERQAKDVNTNA